MDIFALPLARHSNPKFNFGFKSSTNIYRNYEPEKPPKKFKIRHESEREKNYLSYHKRNNF